MKIRWEGPGVQRNTKLAGRGRGYQRPCLNYTFGSSTMPVRWSFVAVRSAVTGAILALTALTSNVGELWITDLGANGRS